MSGDNGGWHPVRDAFYPLAIADFYTFLYKKGFIDKYNLKNIKETCKDKEWFAQRLKSYFEAHEDEFEDWIMEYDYRMM